MPVRGRRAFALAAAPYVVVGVGLYALRNAWLAVGLYQALMVIVVMSVRCPPVEVDIARWRHVTLTFATIVVAGACGTVLFLMNDMVMGGVPVATERLAGIALTVDRMPMFIGWFILLTPYLEERYWRGCLVPDTKRLHWSDAAFAGYHMLPLGLFLSVPWLMLALAILIVAGWFFRRLTPRVGTVTIAIVHAALDLGLLWSVYLWLLPGHGLR